MLKDELRKCIENANNHMFEETNVYCQAFKDGYITIDELITQLDKVRNACNDAKAYFYRQFVIES